MTSIKERVAVNLRLIRKERQKESEGKAFSQTDLANRADLSRTYIAQIENGYTRPSFDVLDRIADVLEVDPVELFKPIDRYD